MRKQSDTRQCCETCRGEAEDQFGCCSCEVGEEAEEKTALQLIALGLMLTLLDSSQGASGLRPTLRFNLMDGPLPVRYLVDDLARRSFASFSAVSIRSSRSLRCVRLKSSRNLCNVFLSLPELPHISSVSGCDLEGLQGVGGSSPS
jgi:hypothetical protein